MMRWDLCETNKQNAFFFFSCTQRILFSTRTSTSVSAEIGASAVEDIPVEEGFVLPMALFVMPNPETAPWWQRARKRPARDRFIFCCLFVCFSGRTDWGGYYLLTVLWKMRGRSSSAPSYRKMEKRGKATNPKTLKLKDRGTNSNPLNSKDLGKIAGKYGRGPKPAKNEMRYKWESFLSFLALSRIGGQKVELRLPFIVMTTWCSRLQAVD